MAALGAALVQQLSSSRNQLGTGVVRVGCQ
jgi:hypothetical protein